MGGDFLTREPEGIALYTCGPDQGYWIVTEQSGTANTFYVLDRRSFRRLGAFRGAAIANTDGVALTQGPVGGWAEGAFFAVHDVQSVGVFPWARIGRALGLRSRCPASAAGG